MASHSAIRWTATLNVNAAARKITNSETTDNKNLTVRLLTVSSVKMLNVKVAEYTFSRAAMDMQYKFPHNIYNSGEKTVLLRACSEVVTGHAIVISL